MAKQQTAESFWARVKKLPSGCWEWQGARNSTGYGTVSWHGQIYTAHRVSAWLHGLVSSPSKPPYAAAKTHVLHKCDNRACCNPSHFFLGSLSDNMHDAYQKNRKAQPNGAQHVNAKLTVKQVAQIRKQYAIGKTQVRLAQQYGVSQRAISLIVRGETYKCER